MSPGTLSDKIMTTFFFKAEQFPRIEWGECVQSEQYVHSPRDWSLSIPFWHLSKNVFRQIDWTSHKQKAERQNKDLNTYMREHWPLFMLKLSLDKCNQRQKWITLRQCQNTLNRVSKKRISAGIYCNCSINLTESWLIPTHLENIS